MKKRFSILLPMLMMFFGTISAADYDFHVGGVYYSIIYADLYTPTTNLRIVQGDEKYTGDIIIPSGITVNNIEYTVTNIGQYSFSECPDLTSITFPSGINCKLEVIEPNAFQNCKGLTSLVIPNTVTLIDAYAFTGCSSLKRVTIGSGVKKIGNAAFNNCNSIERVDISDLSVWYDIDFVQYSGGYLATSNPLYYAKHLYLNGEEVTELNVPDKLTQIKPRAFYNCEGLTSVYISNSSSVTSIGESAFYHCKNIASVKFNKELKEIYRTAFADCEEIESIVIPDKVTLIGDGAFSGCSKLKDLTLGNSLEAIETGLYGPAFGGTSITEITVPEKITNLNGFLNSKLSIVNIGKTSLTEISGTGRDAILPIERINITDLAIFMGIKKQLGGYDLYLNGNLVEDLTIPSSVSEIGERGMQGCKSLKSITIPSHVKTINDKAFNGCDYIETITFEDGSPTIGKEVFGTYNNTYIISKMQKPSEAPNGIINECQSRNILCVPAGCKETYEAAEGWNTFRYIVEASGPEEAFLDRGNLYRIYGDEVTLVKGGAHAYWGYYLPETATYQEKTYPITVIGGEVHDGFSPGIVIYAPVKQIAGKAFASCTGVKSVTSYIKEPFAINSNVFSDEVKQGITLLVPYGTKAKYQATDGWKEFANIEEMEPETKINTVAEVIAGADDETYRVKGICTGIYNLKYGNWYLRDNTGELTVYGTRDKNGNTGATYPLDKWGISVGDIVTVEGPKTTYANTVELVDVQVIDIEKAEFTINTISPNDGIVEAEGGDVTVTINSAKGEVSIEIPQEAQDWLSIASITQGTAPVVILHVAANEGLQRSVKIKIKNSAVEYYQEMAITQKSLTTEVTVEQFLAAEPSDQLYAVTGVLTAIEGGPENQMSWYSFELSDFSGKMASNMLWPINKMEGLGYKVGDIITLFGKRVRNDGTDYMQVSSTALKHKVTETSIADFLTKEDSKDVYYMVTGTVEELLSTTVYCHLRINDGQGNSLYVYRCSPGYGASLQDCKDFTSKANYEVGDQVTFIGYKDTYKDTVELVEAICISHVKNGPKTFTSEDIMAVVKMMVVGGYSAEYDVNGDGQINVADIIAIVNAM